MLRTLLFLVLLNLCTALFAQEEEDFKKPDPFVLNLITGYQSSNSFSDINAKLIANGFQKINYSPFAIGFEFAGYGKRSLLIDQFYFTNVFHSKSKFKTQMETANISIVYGYDIIPKAKYTYLYPLAGLRLHDISIYSKRIDETEIDAHKPMIEALFGFGARQFLNKGMTGVFNNLGLNFLFSVPVINSRWRKDGREFISDTYKVKPTFSLTLTFGRAFFPAPIN